MKKTLHLAFILSIVTAVLPAATLTENFNDVTSLLSSGWTIRNQSSPAGLSSWFQGNTAVFAAQAGPADSYIAANFEAAGASGNVSDWLISPTISLFNGDTLSFFSRSDGAYADRLEVRYSTTSTPDVGATAASLGSFTNLLLSINPEGTAAGYPTSWTQYTASLSGLDTPVNGHLAFRYLVSDTSVNGDYIGIDSLSFTSAVPEPSTMGMLWAATGLFAGFCLWNRLRVIVQKQPE